MIRSGSIIPLGPAVQYAAEKPADPIELRIYPGADGSFTLYEDENDNYNYEKGVYSTIAFHWDDAGHLLTIDARKGSFPGMLKDRVFNVVVVGKDHGTGVEFTANPDKAISYNGEQQIVQLSNRKALSSYDPQVNELLSRMTLEEKIGQMIQSDQELIKDPADIGRYFMGSVLSGGNSDPSAGNGLEAWADLYDRCQQQALKTRLGIPILYGIDAVHGHNNVMGAVIFPHNIGLGCTRDPELVEKVARVTAEEVRASGIQWTFAPCVTVPRDERWGRTYEGFSEDPGLVSILGEAAVRGFQGSDLSDPLSILACAKHYIGDGGTAAVMRGRGGAHLDQGDTKVDEQTLRRLFLPPYISAVNAGVGSIMPSYNSWNGVKCSASHRLLTEILKQELGFEGFLISDWRAINQIDRDYKTAVKISINAGMDMGMVPSEYKEFAACLKELVQEGAVPMSRIDNAVTRILRVKFAMGLMDKNRSFLADRRLFDSFGSEAHRLVARQAVRQSIVLLKNKANVLPLSKTAHIHVGGKSADNLGNQCGGWTITWEGRSGNFVPGGTSILSAIRNTMSRTAEMTFSPDGTGAEGETWEWS